MQNFNSGDARNQHRMFWLGSSIKLSLSNMQKNFFEKESASGPHRVGTRRIRVGTRRIEVMVFVLFRYPWSFLSIAKPYPVPFEERYEWALAEGFWKQQWRINLGQVLNPFNYILLAITVIRYGIHMLVDGVDGVFSDTQSRLAKGIKGFVEGLFFFPIIALSVLKGLFSVVSSLPALVVWPAVLIASALRRKSLKSDLGSLKSDLDRLEKTVVDAVAKKILSKPTATDINAKIEGLKNRVDGEKKDQLGPEFYRLGELRQELDGLRKQVVKAAKKGVEDTNRPTENLKRNLQRLNTVFEHKIKELEEKMCRVSPSYPSRSGADGFDAKLLGYKAYQTALNGETDTQLPKNEQAEILKACVNELRKIFSTIQAVEIAAKQPQRPEILNPLGDRLVKLKAEIKKKGLENNPKVKNKFNTFAEQLIKNETLFHCPNAQISPSEKITKENLPQVKQRIQKLSERVRVAEKQSKNSGLFAGGFFTPPTGEETEAVRQPRRQGSAKHEPPSPR
jgi:hypothetical protein